MKQVLRLLFITYFLTSNVNCDELSKLQVNELSRKLFQSFAANENIILDKRVESKESKEQELALKLNTLRAKYHNYIKTTITIEYFDQISLRDEILIDRVLFVSTGKPLMMILCYIKYEGGFIISDFTSNNVIQNIIQSTITVNKFSNDIEEPELLKKSLPNLSEETIEKLFSLDEKIKITSDDIIKNLNNEINLKISFYYLGGAKIADNFNTCYYLCRKDKSFMILRVTYLMKDSKIEILEVSNFNSIQRILETFNTVSVKK